MKNWKDWPWEVIERIGMYIIMLFITINMIVANLQIQTLNEVIIHISDSQIQIIKVVLGEKKLEELLKKGTPNEARIY